MPALSKQKREETARRILEALITTDGNIRRAAALVGYSRRHLYRWLERERLRPAVNQMRREKAAKGKPTSLDALITEIVDG